MAADGDQDDPDLSGVDEDDFSSAQLDGFVINQDVAKNDYGKSKSQLNATDFDGSDNLQENLSDLNAEDEVEPIDDVLAEQLQPRKFQENSSSFYEDDDGPLDDQL